MFSPGKPDFINVIGYCLKYVCRRQNIGNVSRWKFGSQNNARAIVHCAALDNSHAVNFA
jgi:hypothetical protein